MKFSEMLREKQIKSGSRVKKIENDNNLLWGIK